MPPLRQDPGYAPVIVAVATVVTVVDVFVDNVVGLVIGANDIVAAAVADVVVAVVVVLFCLLEEHTSAPVKLQATSHMACAIVF